MADLPQTTSTLIETEYGKVLERPIVAEMEKSYLDYAMSVIVSRALPDVRDGLKPVHRRILYSMYRSGIHHSSAYKKSARIVGDVLGRYHPHGDSAVYMALVRLAQDFAMRYPLIDGQGNFGSVDGDSPAAMRYTEARLAKITQELLAELASNTVPWSDNFDGSLQEPVVLPAKLPNLLLMGAEGIAVGMATKIPPHHIGEVGAALAAMIEKGTAERSSAAPLINLSSLDSSDTPITENPLVQHILDINPELLAGTFTSDIDTDGLMEHIKGPDFPTAGIIYDRKAIVEAYRTGKGRIVIRAKAEIVEQKKGGFQIIVTELPYQVNKANLLMKIADLVRDKKLDGIRDLRDDSDRKGLQVTIELKRDANPKVVLNNLFKHTELQTTFPMNMVALSAQGVPQLMTLKQVLKAFVEHRLLVITRRSQFELQSARDRAHILEGLLIALNNLDDVIETIRRSPDQDEAKANLIKKFKLSDVQAQAILDMQLKRLAALERQKIEEEYAAISKRMRELLSLLATPQRLLSQAKTELADTVAAYGDERRTKVMRGPVGSLEEVDLIEDTETVITLTASGYVKRMDPSLLRSQSRGGKGARGMTTKAEDSVTWLVTAQTHDDLLLFTNQGRVFKLKVYELPEGSRTAKGTAIVNIIQLQANETVKSLLVLRQNESNEKNITLCTRKGLIKKTAIALFNNIRQTGIIAISLNAGDELVWSKLTSEIDHIIVITHQGKCIRFSESEVKASNRDTKGVKAITLRGDDYVVGMEAFDPNSNQDFQHLLLITENGMGKRTPLAEYPQQQRSGLGVKVADITKKTGPVAAAMQVTELHQEVLLTTESGQAIKVPITDKSIPILTRPTQGVILMRPADGDRIVAAAATTGEEAE